MEDEEIEKLVLYYVIFEKKELDISEDDFVFEKNRKIAKAINNLKLAKKEITILNIQDQIKEKQSQVLEYIANLNLYVFGTNIENLYKALKNLTKKRKIYKIAENIIKELPEINRDDIDTHIDKIINKIKNINTSEIEEKNMMDIVVDTVEEIEKQYLKKDDIRLFTGFFDLDNLTDGLHEQELTIVGARPSVGKTTFALQIAENVASKGIGTLIISLEMSSKQITRKMLSRKTNINSDEIRNGRLQDSDWKRLMQESVALTELPIYITTNTYTIQQIESKIRKLKNEKDIGLVVIDYLQLIRNNNRFNSREQEVAYISRTLKLLALELKIPIIGLCQLNRNATRQEPNLADLRESGAIEQDADNVIFLYREDEEAQVVENINVKLAKQREGATGIVKLNFDKKTSNFRNIMRSF